MKEALFYERLEDEKVRCFLCAHRCIIKHGNRGICQVRQNTRGTLNSLVYGILCTSLNAVDPIEKKPLFHFLPGSASLSISSAGCNLRCLHCQNASISQSPKENGGIIHGAQFMPMDVVNAAQQNRCKSISYTYTEPTISMEFAIDCARAAHERGIKNVFVSNGYMTPESSDAIIPFLDAINIDLKGDDDFYQKICGAKIDPVRDTIKRMRDRGVWVEVTTLIIPGLNDSEKCLRDIAGFIKSVDSAIPWHVTRFHPDFKIMDRPATPLKTLQSAFQIGIETGLKYAYEGNAPGQGGENTYCHYCKELIIERNGYTIINNNLAGSACPGCNSLIEGVW